MIFYLKSTKFAVEVPACDWRLNSKFEVNHAMRYKFQCFFSFRTNTKTGETHASIELKFGKRVGQPQANISNKFCEDPTKILLFIKHYSRKQRSIFWPAYRVNCWLDRPENWYVAIGSTSERCLSMSAYATLMLLRTDQTSTASMKVQSSEHTKSEFVRSSMRVLALLCFLPLSSIDCMTFSYFSCRLLLLIAIVIVAHCVSNILGW